MTDAYCLLINGLNGNGFLSAEFKIKTFKAVFVAGKWNQSAASSGNLYIPTRPDPLF